MQRLLEVGLGSAAVGYLEKNVPAIPTIPMLGRKGTIAVAAYFLGGSSKAGLARDICIAATALSAYELASEGRISGDDGEDEGAE